MIVEVVPGEVLIEYKKAKFGVNGFNCFGEVVTSDAPDKIDDFQAKIDYKSIQIVENADKKLYKSKIKGFVHYSDNFLKVDNKLTMEKLTRNQRSVSRAEDNNIEVNVSQDDTNKDSIGEGVKLQSESIHITGHVGANSVLEALHLQIDGATHKSSIQYAKDAVINRHKGTLKSNTAKIKLLEGGVVHASTVDVGVALGGTIYAENVTITQVKSYVKVYASNSITIKLISGEDNIFKINYKDVPVMTNKLKFMENEINDLKYKLEAAEKNAQNKVPSIKKKIKDIKLQEEKIKETAKHATITIEQPLKGLNTIIFTLDSGDEIIYKTDPLLYKPFYIELKDDKLTLFPVNKTISI